MPCPILSHIGRHGSRRGAAMNVSINTWMSSEVLRIAILVKNKFLLSLALDLNDFGCEVSIKHNIATASKIQGKLV